MKKIQLIIFNMCLASNFLFAQNSFPTFIEFKSDFEKEVLSNPDNFGSVEWFMAIDPAANFDKAKEVTFKINAFKQQLETKKLMEKSEKKTMKIMFNAVHDRFFSKYQNISNFDRIFSSKEFNCVSGTALYGILMDDLQIPYSVKEAPTHVYAVAYPNTESILVESTLPGYKFYSNVNVQEAVTSLVKMKLVTSEEVNSKGINKVYNDYFYSDETISMRQLAGLQYYNEAVSFIEKENFEKAISSIYKAAALYPSKKMDFLKIICLSSVLQKSKFDNHDDILLMVEYANSYTEDHGAIINSYNTMLNNQLLVYGKKTFTDSVLVYVSENLKDDKLLNTLSENHHINNSKYFYSTSNSIRALESLERAYEINDQNVTTKNNIAQTIMERVINRSNTSAIEYLKEYQKKYAFLSENSKYQGIYLHKSSLLAYQTFSANKIEEGLRMLEEMERVYDKFGEELGVDNLLLGMVYAEAGAAYYRKGQRKGSRAVLQRGLKYFPDHFEIMERLKIVNGRY